MENIEVYAQLMHTFNLLNIYLKNEYKQNLVKHVIIVKNKPTKSKVIYKINSFRYVL